MALNYGANKVEGALGHDDQDRAFTTDISNPERDGGKWADPSGEKMEALAWMGKGIVEVGMFSFLTTYIIRLFSVMNTYHPCCAHPHGAFKPLR